MNAGHTAASYHRSGHRHVWCPERERGGGWGGGVEGCDREGERGEIATFESCYSPV